jgi:transcriptional regulator with XRE-family HTH domain
VTLDDHAHDLAAHIGSTLRQHRDRHRLSQAELAERAAISQSAVARIEHGGRGPRIDTLARLFAVLGCQVRLALEPLDKEIDEAFNALAGVPIGERVAEARIPEFAEKLAAIPHVFIGASAALLQGAPVPVEAMEIALERRDGDRFTVWLDKQYASRWNTRFQEYGSDALDPRLPGELRWRIRGNVFVQVELVDRLPDSIEIRHDGRGYRVLPLTEIEVTDPRAARLLDRYRQHIAATG